MGTTAGNTTAAPKGRAPSEHLIQRLWRAFWRDPTAQRRNALVELYQPLVRRVVGRFAARLPRSVDRGDLETAANVGLIGAIGTFDPNRQVRFEAYAEPRIRGALLDELRSEDWLPRPWRQRIEQHKRVLEELRGTSGREPRDEEVAEALGLELADYQLVFGVGLPGASTGAVPTGEDRDEARARLDGLEDPTLDHPGEELTRAELLRLAAQRMTEQEYRIVYLKYWEELPMREIGLLTGLSESRVWKIHSRLLERLKDRFRVTTELDA